MCRNVPSLGGGFSDALGFQVVPDLANQLIPLQIVQRGGIDVCKCECVLEGECVSMGIWGLFSLSKP